MSDLIKTYREQGHEIERWLKLSANWDDVEKSRVLIGWLGTLRAKEMNDFLEKKLEA